MSEPRCEECKGRGWHIGDCHPREECGACKGTGLANRCKRDDFCELVDGHTGVHEIKIRVRR